MYDQFEIEISNNWAFWLAQFRVGDKKPADIADRPAISVSISNTFHKKGRAKFKTYIGDNEKGKFTVERLA